MKTRQHVVLLAQEHDDSRQMYAEFLTHEGFAVVAVDNARDAFAAAIDADVVVTSIRLREQKDGVALIERIRSNDRTKRTPIIVVAADVFARHQAAARTAGCDVFL